MSAASKRRPRIPPPKPPVRERIRRQATPSSRVPATKNTKIATPGLQDPPHTSSRKPLQFLNARRRPLGIARARQTYSFIDRRLIPRPHLPILGESTRPLGVIRARRISSSNGRHRTLQLHLPTSREQLQTYLITSHRPSRGGSRDLHQSAHVRSCSIISMSPTTVLRTFQTTLSNLKTGYTLRVNTYSSP